MNETLEMESSIQANAAKNHRLEIPVERAKITGLICIGCAVIAVLFAFLGSMLFSDLSQVAIILYFVFLLLSAPLSGCLHIPKLKLSEAV